MDLRYYNKIFIILSFLTIILLSLFFINTKNHKSNGREAIYKSINFIKMENEKLKADYLLIESNYNNIKKIVDKQNLKPKSLSEKLLEIDIKKNMNLKEKLSEIDRENKSDKKIDGIEKSKSLSEKLLNIDIDNSSKNLSELFIKEKATNKLQNIELINSISEELSEVENNKKITSSDILIEDENVMKNLHVVEEVQIISDIKSIKKIIPIENFNELFEADKSQRRF
ncbi:MAG: hypothetical protein ACRC2N_15165 [Aeromonas sp.]